MVIIKHSFWACAETPSILYSRGQGCAGMSGDRSKVVCLVADGKDVARCGLSIGLFLASLFHD